MIISVYKICEMVDEIKLLIKSQMDRMIHTRMVKDIPTFSVLVFSKLYTGAKPMYKPTLRSTVTVFFPNMTLYVV